ncbi:MAG TPA: hypothetical protein VFH38_12860 [Jatrophihabitans sp.]|nr:hypothetical protein [Jatrophihabitans sp.]
MIGHSRPARAAAAGMLVALLILAGCSASASSDSPPTRAEIAALLAGHARAVRTGDRAAFLAGVDDAPAARRFRQAQAGAFANLARLPLTRWFYRLGPRAQAPGAQAAARRRYGASAVIYRVQLSYALRGADRRPTSHQLWWTFTRKDGRVVAADDRGLAAVGGASWRGPWDFGPLDVVRGSAALVLGHPGDAPLLQSLAGTVDAAVPAVSAVWGTGWARSVVVLVPRSPVELQADLGTAADVGEPAASVAAVAVSDATDPVTGAVLGQRLVVEPDQLRRLSPIGRQIVIRHEVTHIADAAATSGSTPRWLAEGFAEYVGNLGSGQPVRTAAAELRAAVEHGRVPRQLPGPAAFAASATAAQAYAQAWLACRLIAARVGVAGLVTFYRAVGAAGGTPHAAVARAVRHVLAESLAAFTAQWRGYLVRELGGRVG